MVNQDSELYDHLDSRDMSEEFDPDERCYPGGPFHNIEAITTNFNQEDTDRQTPNYRCRHCGYVWCENPINLSSKTVSLPLKKKKRIFNIKL